jgi:ribonuclease HII
VSQTSEYAPLDSKELENLSKESLIALIVELDAKYRQSIQEFEHLTSQLEIKELVLDTQKKMVEDALGEIHELSITDHLTKLHNRRYFNDIFKTQPLTFYELAITLAVSSIVFWAVEIQKWIKRNKK